MCVCVLARVHIALGDGCFNLLLLDIVEDELVVQGRIYM